ncbi:hypothetical protein BC835DRAFT_1280555 [Cytidiella melzeri]|nr:hypothetical protein BC835DRAFT_1280555 [Cytidiella melzeri]
MLSHRAVRFSRRYLNVATKAASTRPLAFWNHTPPIFNKAHSRDFRRYLATPPPQLTTSDLPIATYHAYSDATMETLLDSLEGLLDDEGNPDYEVEYSAGVLTLKLGVHGTYVINKQPPNKQIWLSSPVSGPKRYDYVAKDDQWVYSRDKQSLGSLLNEELSKAFDQDIDLGIGKVSTMLD